MRYGNHALIKLVPLKLICVNVFLTLTALIYIYIYIIFFFVLTVTFRQVCFGKTNEWEQQLQHFSRVDSGDFL